MEEKKKIDDLIATEMIYPGDYCVVDGQFVRKITDAEITERLGGEDGRKAYTKMILDENSYPSNFSE